MISSKQIKALVSGLMFIVLTISCQNENKSIDISTIKNLDLHRYLGTWYEIARFDHSFERNLVNVTATYSMSEDSVVKVVNQGNLYAPEGKLKKTTGTVKFTDDPGTLKVSFYKIFSARYLILELDENYQWALVGGKSTKYLWILSRSPILDDDIKNLILQKAEKRGYDISKLIWVKQKY